jgi:hypothetical protein
LAGIDRARSVVVGGAMVVVVVVVVVELVVDGAVVTATATLVVGADEGDVRIVGLVVSGLLLVAAVDGGVVVVVGEPAAASLHAESSNRPASNDIALRPAMRGDHTELRHAVRLTMLTIHISISIDTETDQESGTILAERLKDIVWKEAYENMQLPATSATGYAEHS